MTCSTKVGGVGLGWGEAKAHLILDNTRKMHPSNLGGLLRGAFSLENARIFRGVVEGVYINKEQTWGVITFVALEHTVDAAQHMGVGVGWDVITFAALEHIVDAAQHMGVGVGWHWFLLDSDESWGFTNTGSKESRALDVYKVPRAALGTNR